MERNSQMGAMPLTRESEVSLVAGDVTGGGGKATTTKTYRHSVSIEIQQNVQTFWVLTGDDLAARLFGIQNR